MLGFALQAAYFVCYYTVGPDSAHWYILLIYTSDYTWQMLTTLEISFASLQIQISVNFRGLPIKNSDVTVFQGRYRSRDIHLQNKVQKLDGLTRD